MKITDVSSSSPSDNHDNVDNEAEPEENVPGRRKRNLLDRLNILVEELDFSFVEKCTDPLKIERILRILRSGEEGIYPDLENCVVARLQKLKPSSRLLRVETPALRSSELGSEEKRDIENGLAEWLSAVGPKEGDPKAKTIFDVDAHLNFPLPVRHSSEQKRAELKGEKGTKTNVSNPNNRIKSWEYDKWDKFDVDAELTKFDIMDMQNEEWEKREKPNVIAEQKQIEKLMKNADKGGDKSSTPALRSSELDSEEKRDIENGLTEWLSTVGSKEGDPEVKSSFDTDAHLNFPLPVRGSSKQKVTELKSEKGTKPNKPKPKMPAPKNEPVKSLGRSYIEEVDDDEDDEAGVQVTVPRANNSVQHPRKTRVVIDDLNWRM